METDRWAVADTRYLNQGLVDEAIEFVITQSRAEALNMTPKERAQWHADNLNREESRGTGMQIERWTIIPLPPSPEFEYMDNPSREASHSICIECQNKMGRYPSKEKIKKYKEDQKKKNILIICAWCKRVVYDPELEINPTPFYF